MLYNRFFAFVALCFFVFSSNITSAQSDLQQGWDAFLKNDYSNAKIKFETAVKNTSEKNEALLGLALLCENDQSKGNSFDYFNQFYKESTNSAPYIFALWSTSVINWSGKKSPGYLNFLTQLSQKNEVDGSLRAMAFSMIGKQFEDAKNFNEAKKNYLKIGAVEPWQITGEFENISSSGFNKSYLTLKNPNADAEFINKYGAKINWFNPPFVRHDKWFDFTYYFDYSNSVVFAQTYVNSLKEQEVQLRVGVSGSVKTWVNDQLIISEVEERNNDLDTYIKTIKLHKGFNRILMQIGESYAGRSNFLVRLTNSSGEPISGLSYSDSFKPYEAETSFQTQNVPLFAEEYFSKQIEKNPEIQINHILLAKTYLRNDKTFETRQIVEQLKKKYPNSTYLNTLLINVFSRNDNRTGLESTQEAIKILDPTHPIAVNLFYNNAVEKEDYVKAEEYLKQLEGILGANNEEILAKRILMAGYNKEQNQLIKIAEQAYVKYPENKTFVQYKYLIEKEIKKNNQSAINVLKKYLDKNDDWSASTTLSQLYFNNSDVSSGLKVYTQHIEDNPVAVGIYNKVSQLYFQLQKYDKAEEFALKAITIAPYIATYHASLAKIYETQNKKDLAIKEYNRALELNARDYESLKDLRKLQNKKDIYDYFETPDVNKIVKNAPSADAYPDDNSIILNENVQTVIYPSGGSEERHLVIAKILNSKGLEDWKQQAAFVSGWQTYIIEDSEVIKADGSKVPAEVKENEMVFTNLEVGDIVFFRYKLYNYPKGQLANKYWNTFYFSHSYPYLNTTYNLIIAKNRPFSFKFSQTPIEPTKKNFEEFDLFTWTKENQASVKSHIL